MSNFAELAESLDTFVDAFSSNLDMFGDTARSLTCCEVEALAGLLRTAGAPHAADVWIDEHTEGNDPDCEHCHGDEPSYHPSNQWAYLRGERNGERDAAARHKAGLSPLYPGLPASVGSCRGGLPTGPSRRMARILGVRAGRGGTTMTRIPEFPFPDSAVQRRVLNEYIRYEVGRVMVDIATGESLDYRTATVFFDSGEPDATILFVGAPGPTAQTMTEPGRVQALLKQFPNLHISAGPR